MPKVSIIVPLYNKAPYVTKALESIASQTFKDWECIIVNDGSTDNSEAVVQSWLAQHSQYTVHFTLYTQENAGVSAARNYGISLSTGDYVCFLDADDWWAPSFLDEMIHFTTEYPDAGLYASNYWYYKPGKTHIAVKSNTGYINYPKLYCEGEMPITSISVLVNKIVIEEMGGFPIGIKLGEDFLLWSKIALQYKVAFLNKPLAYYNNDLPITHRATRNLHAPETHMLWHLDRVEEDGLRTKETADWKRLLDMLRVCGLLKYWIHSEYHEIAKRELQKVDWTKQSLKVRVNYNMPILVVRVFMSFMYIGSIVKQRCLNIILK